MKNLLVALASAAVITSIAATGAHSFMKDGGAAGECSKCHTLAREEAQKLLAGMVDNVLNVEESPVQGLWVVDISKGGRKFPIYIDYSKNFVISAQILRLSTKTDITRERMSKLNEVKADTSRIPLEDALVVGKASAPRKVIVFADPECHFCGKLHGELKAVIDRLKDVAFYIKLYSRNNDPAATEKARAIICAKSLEMLESAYSGKPVPPAVCRTEAPAETFRLAGELNIEGTPALVLPDGRVMIGYRNADALVELLSGPAPAGK